jgi:inner membrane transporter RhtA
MPRFTGVTDPRSPGDTDPKALALVLNSLICVQFGAALASLLFARLGVLGTVTLRIGVAGAVLLAVCRPHVRGLGRGDWLVIGGFGAALAAMNTLLYEAVARIPLGAAVTLEVLGPLALSVISSRRAVSCLWGVVALVGVGLLGRDGIAGGLTPTGVACALGAATMWAAYILLSQRAGRRFTGMDGLALAMASATVLVAPWGIAAAGSALLDPVSLGLGVAVATLSSLLPYACDLAALRRLRSEAFALMMSLSPALATSAGALVLRQWPTPTSVLAVGLVVIANAGSVLEPFLFQKPLRRSQHEPPAGDVDGGDDVAHKGNQRV